MYTNDGYVDDEDIALDPLHDQIRLNKYKITVETLTYQDNSPWMATLTNGTQLQFVPGEFYDVVFATVGNWFEVQTKLLFEGKGRFIRFSIVGASPKGVEKLGIIAARPHKF